MAAWIGLIRYMETSRHYSILARTLNLGMPNVVKTLISALPVLMGYTFLGLALFWKSNRFSSATGCLTTLYALMFGDMVYDTFHDLSQTNYLSSQLYLYSFVFFSVCVINSLFISVIVDAFETAKDPKLKQSKQPQE
jgi:mucolipin 3